MSTEIPKEIPKEVGNLTYDSLTAKSFIVVGDRNTYDAIIKEMGGVWNPRTKPHAGWCVNKIHEPALKKLIDRVNKRDDDHMSTLLSTSQQGIPLETATRKNKKNKDKEPKPKKIHVRKNKKDKTEVKTEVKNDIDENLFTPHFDEKIDKGREVDNVEKPDEEVENVNVNNGEVENVNVDMTRQDEEKTDEEVDVDMTRQDEEKTDEEDREKTEDEDREDEDRDDEEKTDEEDRDEEKTEDEDRDDEEKTEDNSKLEIQKAGESANKKIGNPEETLLRQRTNRFINEYVNSDDEIDPDESKIMLNRFKSYFEYYKTYSRSPEKFVSSVKSVGKPL